MLGDRKDDSVVVFQPPKHQNKFEEAQHVFSGKASIDALRKFIEESVRGVVGVMTPDNESLFRNRKPLLVVYYDLDFKLNPSRAKYIRNRVLKVVSENKTPLTVAVASKNSFPRDSQDVGQKIGGQRGN